LVCRRLPAPASSILSLHDALPICEAECKRDGGATRGVGHARVLAPPSRRLDGSLSSRHPRPPSVQPTDGVASTTSRSESSASLRSEEHTSELQSPDHLVCRLLLEK